MSSEAITQIILGLILIVGAVIGSYGIPLFKAMVEKLETNRLFDFILKAVEWANQTIPAEEWERKKVEVMQKCVDFARNKIHIAFTDEEIETIMEAFVIEVKNAKEKAKKK